MLRGRPVEMKGASRPETLVDHAVLLAFLAAPLAIVVLGFFS